MLLYLVVCIGLMPLSYIFRGGAVRFSFFFPGDLWASCIVLGCLLGFALLVINSYLSKKKKDP